MTARTGRVGKSDVHIPERVITTLGWVAVLGLLGSFVLVCLAVTSRYELDAVKATLITGFMGIGSNAAVALGAILATTRPTSEPQPVTVENPPDNPANVTEQPAPELDPEFGHADPMGLLLVALVVIVLLIAFGVLPT